MLKITCCATKGGVGKTTLCANLSAILADQARVLMIDADPQPSLTGFFPIDAGKQGRPTGLVNLLLSDDLPAPAATTIPNLDVIASDDPAGELENRLLHMPDGRLRMFRALEQVKGYDYVLIDTRGARGALVENAVLAADLCLSPIPPEILAAQEFIRGTLSLFESLQPFSSLGFEPGQLTALFYRTDNTNDAKTIMHSISDVLSQRGIRLLKTIVPNRVVYREAATRQVPVHLHERQRRQGISASQTLLDLQSELSGILDTICPLSRVFDNSSLGANDLSARSTPRGGARALHPKSDLK